MNWEKRDVELAVVRSIKNPIQVELMASSVALEEGDHLQLSQFVRWWDLNYQLRVGDVLVLTRLPDDAFLAFDVRSERDVNAGIRPSRPPATATGDMRAAQAATETGLLDITATASAVPDAGGTPTVTVNVAWNHHIARKLEVYDANGALIGFVPVFTTLP